MHRRTLRTIALTLGVGAALTLAACGDDSDDSGSGAATAGVTVAGQWARTSPMMASAGAAYMTLTSAGDDTLIKASVDPSVAGTVELHETKMADMSGDMSGDISGTTAEGMGGDTETSMAPAMEMVPVDEIELPAGEAVELAPGGLHVMLLDLVAPLEVGTTIQLTLEFENAGTQVVEVPVRDDAP
jgi:copper(I)-binding protein